MGSTKKPRAKKRAGRPKSCMIKTYSRKQPQHVIRKDPFSSSDAVHFPLDSSEVWTDSGLMKKKLSHLYSHPSLSRLGHSLVKSSLSHLGHSLPISKPLEVSKKHSPPSDRSLSKSQRKPLVDVSNKSTLEHHDREPLKHKSPKSSLTSPLIVDRSVVDAECGPVQSSSEDDAEIRRPSSRIFLSDEDSPPPVERLRHAPSLDQLPSLEDFLNDDPPDFVHQLTAVHDIPPKPLKNTSVFAKRASVGTKRSLRSMELTDTCNDFADNDDEATPSMLLKFKDGLGRPVSLSEDAAEAMDTSRTEMRDSKSTRQDTMKNSKSKSKLRSQGFVTSPEAESWSRSRSHAKDQRRSKRMPSSSHSKGDSSSASLYSSPTNTSPCEVSELHRTHRTPISESTQHVSQSGKSLQPPPVTSTLLRRKALRSLTRPQSIDASTQTPPPSAGHPELASTSIGLPVGQPSEQPDNHPFRASTPSASQENMSSMHLDASAIIQTIRPLLCSTCRSTLIADHIPVPVVSPVERQRHESSKTPMTTQDAFTTDRSHAEALGEPLLSSTHTAIPRDTVAPHALPSPLAAEGQQQQQQQQQHKASRPRNKSLVQTPSPASAEIGQPLLSSTRASEGMIRTLARTASTSEDSSSPHPNCPTCSPYRHRMPGDSTVQLLNGDFEREPLKCSTRNDLPLDNNRVENEPAGVCADACAVPDDWPQSPLRHEQVAVLPTSPGQPSEWEPHAEPELDPSSCSTLQANPLYGGSTTDDTLTAVEHTNISKSVRKKKSVRWRRNIGYPPDTGLCPVLELFRSLPPKAGTKPGRRKHVPLPQGRVPLDIVVKA